MVQALPQYSEQIDKLSLHVEVRSYVQGSHVFSCEMPLVCIFKL